MVAGDGAGQSRMESYQFPYAFKMILVMRVSPLEPLKPRAAPQELRMFCKFSCNVKRNT